MAKLFDYSKPGKGISKDSRKMNSLGMYFSILWEKLWQICILNLMIFVFSIPFFAVSIGIYFLLNQVPNISQPENLQLHIIVSLIPFAFFGPFLSSGYRIVRDFSRGEPVFLLADFFNTLKKNIGQSIVVSVFSYLTFSALSFALPSYYLMESKIRFILFPVALFGSVIIMFMQYYLYLMVITLDLSIRQIFKNAIIFSFVSLKKNVIILLCSVIVVAITVVLFILGLNLTFLLGILAMLWACFFVGYLMFSTAFFAFPEIKRLCIDPYYKSHPEETSVISNDTSVKPESEQNEILLREQSEYVYHNGRMVHRSVLENEVVFNDDIKDTSKGNENE